MADTAQLEVLEKRMTALETIVFGNADKDALYPKCIESLLVLQNKIMAAVAGKKKLTQVYENLPALRQYMDPAYTDELGLSEEAKAEVIFAEEEYLRRMASQLQTIKEQDDLLSSEHVKSVPKLSGKLQELSQVHIQQQDETAQVTEETARLIDSYNSVITTLSKMFIQWDAEITKLEIQSQPNKSDT
ncbi:dynactin subunit 3-like isoform X2 [Babylonia areolata]|uniref:dynactin subunit 3-like isoform X2 n=1 Tax=Babylonia areolata TaxID=304850 RepID=UPI003FD42D1C